MFIITANNSRKEIHLDWTVRCHLVALIDGNDKVFTSVENSRRSSATSFGDRMGNGGSVEPGHNEEFRSFKWAYATGVGRVFSKWSDELSSPGIDVEYFHCTGHERTSTGEISRARDRNGKGGSNAIFAIVTILGYISSWINAINTVPTGDRDVILYDNGLTSSQNIPSVRSDSRWSTVGDVSVTPYLGCGVAVLPMVVENLGVVGCNRNGDEGPDKGILLDLFETLEQHIFWQGNEVGLNNRILLLAVDEDGERAQQKEGNESL